MVVATVVIAAVAILPVEVPEDIILLVQGQVLVVIVGQVLAVIVVQVTVEDTAVIIE